MTTIKNNQSKINRDHKEMKERLLETLIFKMEKIFSLQEEEETTFRFYNKNFKNLYESIDGLADNLSTNDIKLLIVSLTVD